MWWSMESARGQAVWNVQLLDTICCRLVSSFNAPVLALMIAATQSRVLTSVSMLPNFWVELRNSAVWSWGTCECERV